MRIVCVDSLTEGMVTARNLLSSDGRLILAAGSAIKKRHIETMRCWGISEACIYQSDKESSPVKTEASAKELPYSIRRKLSFFPPSDLKDLLMSPSSLCDNSDIFINPPPVYSDLKGKGIVPFSLQDIISVEPGLSAFSPVLSKILKVLSSPDSSAVHIARVVSGDSAMALKILRLVNSPLYGFSRHIKSISQAVAIIGSKDLMNIAIQISSINYFKGISSSLIDMKCFWEHSISCAIFARILASKKMRVDDSYYFIGGMCLNLGRLVTLRHMPEVFERSLSHSWKNETPLKVSEGFVMGYSSDDISKALFEKWFIPAELGEALFMRSDRDSVLSDIDSAVFHVAETLAVAVGDGFAGDYFVPPLIDGVLDFLGYSVNDIRIIISQFKRQQREVIDAFLGGVFQ